MKNQPEESHNFSDSEDRELENMMTNLSEEEGDVQIISKDEMEIDDNKKMENKKKNITRKKAQPRKGLGEELMEVYETTGENFSSPNRLERKRRAWQRMLVWILLFLVAVFIGVAIVSWFIWGSQPKYSGDLVGFSISGPEKTASGDDIELVVEYSNQEVSDFRKSEIELRYPVGFIFEQSTPQPSDGKNLWDIGALAGGVQDKIIIKGILVGKPDSTSTLSGVLRFWPANFNSEFQEVASIQTTIEAADIEARIEGPEQILVGQNTGYSIIYSNEGEKDLNDLQVEIFYPQGFVVEKTSIDATEDNNLWQIEKLLVGEEQEIIIEGYFSDRLEEESDLIVEISQKGSTDEYFVQKKIDEQINTIAGDMVVNVIANGETQNGTLQWGDIINLNVNFENNSETELGNITVITTIESRYLTQDAEDVEKGAISWDSLVDVNKGSLKQIEGFDEHSLYARTITWSYKDLDKLKSLPSEQEDELNIQVELVNLEEAKKRLSYPEDVAIMISAEVMVEKTGDTDEELLVTSNKVNFSINSDLLFEAQARYFDAGGVAVGSGPLPPQVGQETEYRIYWDLTNRLHEVQDIIVNTELPSNVVWKNDYEVSAGEVEYQSDENRLTWHLNKIPLDVQNVTLNFAVGITPKQTQAGETAALTKKLTMTSTDSVTGGKIIQTILPLTTGVEKDSKASDKGLVAE